MDSVALLRELWRHKEMVAVGALLAIATAILMSFRIALPGSLESRERTVGIASTSALVDTPSSQVVDLGGKDAADGAALPARAQLLANLLTASPLKDEIAKKAGIDPAHLIASAAEPGAGAVAKGKAPLASGAKVSAGDPQASTLTLRTDVTLPIISVDTQSPDAETATKLANATVAVLQADLQSIAGSDGVPFTRRLVVKQLGPARAGVITQGPSRLLAIVAALMVFALVCAASLGVSALAREWRMAEALEQGDMDDDDRPRGGSGGSGGNVNRGGLGPRAATSV